MRNVAWLLVVVTALTLPAVFAQEGGNDMPAGNPQAGPTAGASTGPLDQEYRLVVADTIKIAVEDYPDLDATYTVPANGEVSFPPLGKVNLLGRTTDELSREIEERFKSKGQLTDPKVDVLILSYAPRTIYVYGAATAAIDLFPHKQYSILQILAKAGVSQGTADLQNVKVFRSRPDGKRFPIAVNIEDVLLKNEFEKDILVKSDDVIYVPPIQSLTTDSSVYILGKVRKPGRYAWNPGREQMSLLKLIALAGDFDQFADQGSIRILRQQGNRTQPMDIDFDDIIDNDIQDVVLQPNDVIFVPESPW